MAPGNQYASSFVEVMGRVGEDRSLEEIQSYDLGDNFGAWVVRFVNGSWAVGGLGMWVCGLD